VRRLKFTECAVFARLKRLPARALPYGAATIVGLLLWHAARDDLAVGANAQAPFAAATAQPPITASQPSSAASLRRASATTDVVVGRNDTLDAIFRRIALDPADLAAIRQLPGIRPRLDYLKPGDAIRVTHSGGQVEELSRKVSETQTLHVVRDDAGFAARLVDDPVQTKIRTATAAIDSSLFQAAESAHMSDGIALKVADVFAWDIDFVLDIREGDRFTAIYEQVYQNGKYLRDGDLLAAEFVNSGRVYRAIRFVNEAGVAEYYSPDGKPMRKAFLRAPVEFTRVSSVFNPHRLHPILNLIRGHMGTDYAAPIGTPVRAAGEGRVSFAGTRGGYGNAIMLSHTNNISTLYGHMSRFARNIHVGTHVQQGEVIGYVGMTGLATGPHLHYEYLVNGVHKDPQTVKLAGAEPLHPEIMAKFRAATSEWLAELVAPHAEAVAPRTSSVLPAGLSAAGISQYLGEPHVSAD
jgi:murein DD-endopeptidase MepM/ murein hydrolase activator NlpD